MTAPTPRDRALAGEVVKVTDERLAEMQRIAIDNEDAGTYSMHWHWAAAINELIAARKEIERLTRERDEARSASVPGSAAVFAAVEAERDRMRAALEKIADFDCRSDEHVGDMKCWSCYARDALSSEPSPDETTARRMTRAEADAMNRAFWRSVEIIDDIDDREEVAPGDARYYRPSENPSICPYGQSDCETTRGGVCQCAMPAEQAFDGRD